MPARQTTESFTTAATAVHGERYDYSRVAYTNNKTPVAIVCPEHGEFLQTPADHIHSKAGCPACSGNEKLSLPKFLEEARVHHGEKYDYSQVKITNNLDPVTIICPEHGAFEQAPKQHRLGRGCPTCGGTKKLTLEEILARFQAAHGSRYDYSRVALANVRNEVTIICREHGEFDQIVALHADGRNCPKCVAAKGAAEKRTPLGDLQQMLESARPGTAIDLANYENRNSKISLQCPRGHEYTQRVGDVKRYGCSTCAGRYSSGEQELRAFVTGLGVRTEKTRKIVPPKELDLWCPDHNVGFEFNGLYYHSDATRADARTTHKHKSDGVRAAGGSLVHIWSDDWTERRSAVEGLIRAKLGLLPSIGARTCRIAQVPKPAAKAFLAVHHLQGWTSADYLGLYDASGTLVACMGFAVARSARGNTDPRKWELVRYAASARVAGGGSRLLSAWKRAMVGQWDTLTTYCDLAQFDGGLYTAMGFSLAAERGTDYKVLKAGTDRRLHKSTVKKAKLRTLLGPKYDDSKTEAQLCKENHIFRIWDCGMRTYVLHAQ